MDSSSNFYVMGTGSRGLVQSARAHEVYNHLRQYILMLRECNESLVLISGMAEGWDEMIAKIGFREGIPYVCAIPNSGYGRYYWQRKSLLEKDRFMVFKELVAGAAEVHYVCKDLYENGVHANFVRNQWMVDHCHAAVVYNSKSPGTRDAVARLRTAEKPYEEYPFTGKQLSLL
jgi:hypothetical protein